MPKIHGELKQLDPAIAEAYLAVTLDNAETTIDKAGAKRIFDAVFEGDEINEKRAKALVLILQTHARTVTKDARQYLSGRASTPQFEASLFVGTMKRLTDEKELSEFYKTIDFVAKHLTFKSVGTKGAGTKIYYGPHHYVAVRKLVEEWEIGVFRQADSGLQAKLTSAAGEYKSDQDNVVLIDGINPQEQLNSIVHEVTHAIQDWLDVRCAEKYLEADAYVAGAVADVLLGRQRDKQGKHPLDVAWAVAAPLVLDGTAVTEKASWLKAYDTVVRAIVAYPHYKEFANDKADLSEPGRKPRKKPGSAPAARSGSEKKNMVAILKELQGQATP